jgi:uncharacterized membrane protein
MSHAAGRLASRCGLLLACILLPLAATGCKKSSQSNDSNEADKTADAKANGRNKNNPPAYAELDSEASTEAPVATGEQVAKGDKIIAPAADPNAIFQLVDGERKVILCNNFSQSIAVALGLKFASGELTTQGWIVLAKGDCKTTGAGQATHAFTFAKSADGTRAWRGEGGQLCIYPTKSFKLTSTAEASTCNSTAGYDMRPFTSHTLTTEAYTVSFK